MQWMKRVRNKRRVTKDIDLDEIFVDAENLPEYDKHQLEGRIEKPISKKVLAIIVIIFILLSTGYLFQIWDLQIDNGNAFYERSANNRLRHSVIFADRGIIYDRNGVPLAWNEPREEGADFSKRRYTNEAGFANVLGYVKYPQRDSAGFFYSEEFTGVEGVEQYYNELLSGTNGLKIIETNALQDVVGDNTISAPESGERLDLTIDFDLQKQVFDAIKTIAEDVGFQGGAGVIMDIETGELHALISYPEYDPNLFTDGTNIRRIDELLQDPANRFLNRATKGLYTPGSIIKPFVATAALNEEVIRSGDHIVSSGTLEVPNPYDPDNPSIFTDWKAHGPVNVREALAYSSNIYFYQVGGGYEPSGQAGVGISNLEKYLRSFGFGKSINDDFLGGAIGTIPNPGWKAEIFDGDIWRLGDTYFTSIGQYGLQVTPLQVARATAALANGGKIIEPRIVAQSPVIVSGRITDIDSRHFDTVRSGMRDAVIFGTAQGINFLDVRVAAKTGTAELGVSKAKVNSWVIGFFPYNDPRYTFVVVMEKGSRKNLIGGVAVMRQILDWMRVHKPAYLGL